MKCQICACEKVEKVLDLGVHPPPLNFLSEKNDKNEKSYPLKLYFCHMCNLVQLEKAVDPNVMFRTYTYTSGVSNSFKIHLEKFAKYIIEKFQLKSDDLVIDIGSNDGTLLQFLKFNTKVLGVEPSNVAEISKKNKIPTINDFFNEKVAEQILSKHGKAKIITALNVFAHVDKLDSFMKGIRSLLHEDGIFVTESQYLMDIIEQLEYDTIYHEHLRYYGLKQLKRLFEMHDMEVFDAERIPAQGGSIRVFASFKGKYPENLSVKKILENEEEHKLHDIKTIKEFARRVDENKKQLKKILLDLKHKGNSIAAISAPARSSTILNFCNIDSSILDFVAEKSPLKIGKFTPGTHIKVVDDSTLSKIQPDFALLLSWHLKDSIIPKIKNDGYKGKIIVPLPTVQVI